MPAKRCWECSNTFYSDFGAIYCNVCNQARKNREHSERQARQDRWAAEQAQREAARIQAQHTQALINAENRRIAAINHQTQVIQESIIPSKDAYERGNDYPDTEFGVSNAAELEVEVNENGTLSWKWYPPYATDRLNNEFSRGLSNNLSRYNIYTTIKDSAKRAGKQNAEGTLPSRFTLHTGLSLARIPIKTKVFDSKFTNVLDESTGEQVMRWNQPFQSEELNKAYLAGVNEVHWAVNTEEKKNYRLKFEVPKLIAERKIAKATKNYNKLYKVMVILLPILFFYFTWPITSGWVAFFVFVSSILMYKFLKKKHIKWQETNNHYLT